MGELVRVVSELLVADSIVFLLFVSLGEYVGGTRHVCMLVVGYEIG